MPTPEMEAIRQSLARAEELAAEVRKLRLQTRLLGAILAVVVVVAIFAGGVALYARSAANKAQRALDVAKAQVTLTSVEACRARNSADETTRATFETFVDGIDQLVTTPDGHAAIARLRASIPTPAMQDRDCTTPANGLGPDDYPS